MKHLLVVLFVLLPSLVSAQVIGRDAVTLSKGWQYLRGDVGSAWEVFRPIPGAGKPEAVPLWTEVTLPHCFNATDAVDPDVPYYQGPGWYRTVLPLSCLDQQGRQWLQFEGAGQTTQVYLFTTLIAEHVGGYDEWQVDLTPHLRSFAASSPDVIRRLGGIPLAVRCDNSRRVELIPSDMSDFNLYGGLYRPVHLITTPESHITGWQVDASVDEQGRQGQVDLRLTPAIAPGHTAQLQLRLLDAQGRELQQQSLELQAGAPEQTLRFTLRRPHRWDVTDPYLYRLELQLTDGADQLTDSRTFGFRHFRFAEHGPFYLNGRRLLLQGTHRHEDHAGVAAALTPAMMQTEMQLMHQMGVNFIRLGHYQQSRRILELCDSLGILVWEEIPWCRGGLGGPAYQQQARQMLRAMIGQHRHHPSVILWGMGNENDWPGDFPTFSQDSIRAFMRSLVDLSHELDPSRLTTIRRCDFCRNIVDVYSPSIWPGWYSRRFTDFAEMERQGFESVPRFLHAEWGADSHVGRHLEASLEQQMATVRGDANGQWDETYAALLFDWSLHEQAHMPWLTGTAIWTFSDFSTPLRPTNPIPYMNQKGLVERDGTPKEAYYVVQSYWATEPMVHIYGHSWPTRWGEAGQEKPIWVYSNAPSVELLLDGTSLGTRQRDNDAFPAAGLHWSTALPDGPYQLVAIARDARGHIVCADTLQQSYQTTPWSEPAAISLRTLPQPDGTALIEATVTDAHGTPCLDCADVIEWDCTSRQRLLTEQGTSTGSRIIQAANGRTRIRLLPGLGPVAVSATIAKRGITALLEVE